MKTFLKPIIVWMLTLEAKLVLKKYKPSIIVVTGSVGKTSTKDAVAEVVSRFSFARKSEKSFNSDTGVPLTILGCKNPWNSHVKWFKVLIEGFLLIILPNHYPKWLVLEVGADNPGDIRSMMEWITPQVVVVTKLPEIPVHVEAYASPDETREEEFSPAYALPPEGTLIYSRDDTFATELARGVSCHTLTYGFKDESTVRAGEVEVGYGADGFPVGIVTKVEHRGSHFPLQILGTVGVHQMYPALAALAVADALDITMVDALEHLQHYIPPQGRMRLLEAVKGALMIDDSYNASPTAVSAALVALSEIQVKGKKIVVLGDMLELGTFSMEEHRRIGQEAAKVADVVIGVGVRARGIAEGAEGKEVYHFTSADGVGEFITERLEEGDVVLVKGSQGVRLERVTEVLLKEKEKAGEVLVRQDAEWKRR